MISVYLREHFVSDALDVFVVRQYDGVRAVLHREDSALRWDDVGQEHAALPDGVLEPTFTLPFDSGRALLEALTRHYNGAEDTRQLRKDYEFERQRVDSLIGALTRIACGTLP